MRSSSKMNYHHNHNRKRYSNGGGNHHNHRHHHYQQRHSHQHDHMYGVEMDVEGAVVEDYEQQRRQNDGGGYYNESRKAGDGDDDRSSLSQCLLCIACLFLIASGVLVGMTFLVWNNRKGGGGGKNKNNNKALPWYHNTSLLLNLSKPLPFSLLDPANDLDLIEISERSVDSTPPKKVLKNYKEWLDMQNTQLNVDNDIPIPTKKRLSVPTNVWYENLLLLQDNDEYDNLAKPTSLHRVHTIPYVIDVAGIIPGVQIHGRSVWDTTNTTTQLSVVDPFSLLLGAHVDFNQQDTGSGSSYMHDDSSYRYAITSGTELGVTLQWDKLNMKSSFVRGMPYVTMTYSRLVELDESRKKRLLPTIMGTLALQGPPTGMNCGFESSDPTRVSIPIKVRVESGVTWMVFFSRPVTLQCRVFQEPTLQSIIQVVYDGNDSPLTIRVAMLHDNYDNTTGIGSNMDEYETLLTSHALYYPGEETSMSYKVEEEVDDFGQIQNSQYQLELDWNVQRMTETGSIEKAKSGKELIMFALPHHMDTLNDNDISTTKTYSNFCIQSLLGPACILLGNSWIMKDEMPNVSFYAPRSPKPEFFEPLIKALSNDISYAVQERYQRGAGDTYFSGKQIARLGRILLIANEVLGLCSSSKAHPEYTDVCKSNKEELPTKEVASLALDRLRSSVEIWLNGTAESPFVYDSTWGGLISCGCLYDGQHCTNKVGKDCPAFSTHDVNFGNGFYNDHHFHYGYHIYAAAIVAQFDPKWGRNHFERVLLLVRDIANPSKHDTAFPRFRHKDWYRGHSWASGITAEPYFNGRNQESSSEAIAAYEAIALFGKVMVTAFENVGDIAKTVIADEIRKVGLVLTTTEIRATQRYWHVYHNVPSKQIYPSSYEPSVVGIMWGTLMELRTWFGGTPYLAYGIQTVPLTPIAEVRDQLDWAYEAFPAFAKECETECVRNGWSNGELALLATVGHPDLAIEQAMSLPKSVFETPGGNGHSKSNTVWYLATRPDVSNIFPLDQLDFDPFPEDEAALNCYTPDTCTKEVLEVSTGDFTCRERIAWLVDNQGISVYDACLSVAVNEYPNQCSACRPPAA